MLYVRLACTACGCWAQVWVRGGECAASPDLVHLSRDEPRVLAWRNSHHAPCIELLGIRE